MRDYISTIFDSFKTKSEAYRETGEVNDLNDLIDELSSFKRDFENKIMKDAAGVLTVSADSPVKFGDKVNPVPLSLNRINDALQQTIAYCKLLKQDPLANEDDMSLDLPDMPDISMDVSLDASNSLEEQEIKESNYYYNKLHPEKGDEILQLNGWNYSNGEIWDDKGVCSISYDQENGCINICELLDPDGVEQEIVATVHSVEELEDALVQFAELNELAPEMKEKFAEYIQERPIQEDTIAPEPDEVKIIDEWEYIAEDPEFEGNSTLLYDKNSFVVFIQKDSDPENPEPYYVQTAGFEVNREHQDSDFEVLCKWLQVNEYPVPTQEAKNALLGIVESINEKAEETAYDKTMKQLCKSAPKDFKCSKDDPEIARIAKEPQKPKVGKAESINEEVEDKENTCPNCGGHNIQYDSFEAEDDKAYYKCYCNDCETSYHEVYSLKFLGNEI